MTKNETETSPPARVRVKNRGPALKKRYSEALAKARKRAAAAGTNKRAPAKKAASKKASPAKARKAGRGARPVSKKPASRRPYVTRPKRAEVTAELLAVSEVRRFERGEIQLFVLELLVTHGPLKRPALTAAAFTIEPTKLNKQRMNSAITLLLEKGFIEQLGHMRFYTYRITSAGRKHVKSENKARLARAAEAKKG